MFAGLLLTAAIAAFAQLEPAASRRSPRSNWIVLILPSSGWRSASRLCIGRISATLALGLFFVFAASLGLIDRR